MHHPPPEPLRKEPIAPGGAACESRLHDAEESVMESFLTQSSVRENSMTTKTSHVRWFLVFWLFVLSAVSYLDRVNISIAGGAIAEAYHLSDVQLGKVFSAMLVGYALFQTVAGGLAGRFGTRCGLDAGCRVVWC